MAPIRTIFIGTAFVLFSFSTAALGEPKVEEQVAGPASSDARYVVSPQGGHIAVVARKGSRMNVIVDGVAGPKVDDVITPVLQMIDPRPMALWTADDRNANTVQPVTFCKDGSHYAYLERTGQEWVLIEDNKEILRLPAGGMVGGTSGIAGMAGNTDIRLQFAGDDGKHLYFAKSSFAGFELWVDGQKMPGYFGSGGGGSAGTIDPLISADGEHFAYMATMGTHPGDKQTLIVDGKDAGYLADNLQMTADGKHIIGRMQDAKGSHLLIDGKSVLQAKQLNAVFVCPTNNRILCALRHDNPNGSIGQFLLDVGLPPTPSKPIEASLCDTIKSVTFSPDGKHYAAICGRSGAEWVVMDGKKGQEYQSIANYGPDMEWSASNLTFSPDSSKLAYIANSQGKAFIVINDDESDAYDGAAFFRFSPSGKRVVTQGVRNQMVTLTIDGKATKMPSQKAPLFSSFQFSPDETRYAWFSGGNPREGGAVTVDGKDTGMVGLFTFSPDSKHVAVEGFSSTENTRGLFADGELVGTTEFGIMNWTFTPDSQHLLWVNREANKDANAAPGSYLFVTYLDGKKVSQSDQTPESTKVLLPLGFMASAKTRGPWKVAPDGSLTWITFAGDDVKRAKITPGNDTNVEAMKAEAMKARGRTAEAALKDEIAQLGDPGDPRDLAIGRLWRNNPSPF